MKINDMQDALNNKWLPENEKEGDVQKCYIGYLPSKNSRKHVTLIIPCELKPLLLYLANPSVRRAAGVLENNYFVFASVYSKFNCSGYHDFKSITNAAGVSILPTQMRHYLSTPNATTTLIARNFTMTTWVIVKI